MNIPFLHENKWLDCTEALVMSYPIEKFTWNYQNKSVVKWIAWEAQKVDMMIRRI
jgi:hypothetical protein